MLNEQPVRIKYIQAAHRIEDSAERIQTYLDLATMAQACYDRTGSDEQRRIAIALTARAEAERNTEL